MAALTSIRDGLKTRLETISGLTASEFVPDYIVPPIALVAPLNTLNYDSTMARGADTYEIPIVVYISRIDAQTSQDEVDAYLASSGATSINTPKSYIYKSLISSRIPTLYLPICIANSSLKSAYSNKSDILQDNPSAKVRVI